MTAAGPSRYAAGALCVVFLLLGNLLMAKARAAGISRRPLSTGARENSSSMRPTSASAPVARPHPAVVQIIVPERGGTSRGSGTLIDTRDQFGLVLTNWHVVRDAVGTIHVLFADGHRSAARALKVDRNWDLAALVIWRPHVAPVPLATLPPQRGDVLTIAGYGQGSYRMAAGHCTQYVAPGINSPFEMVQVGVAARQGDSGGPIFNQRGELAGVLFGSGHGTTTGTFCGRVGGFLASLGPEVGRRTDSALAAMSVSAPATGADTATPAPASQLAANPPRRRPPIPPPATPHRAASVAALPATPTQSLPWQDRAGQTVFGHAKTVLAAIGVLSLMLLAVRMTSR